ncbi:MAG: metal-dependent transcriptional regulator [Flammeovirgaceae bacterium]|nr:metal-dependent transcriptional regulator [Flammeovirgaceae bacterium]MDW8286529.1 metal-dependent transcriptional regulator [Flammeovirgaceae bacterium]
MVSHFKHSSELDLSFTEENYLKVIYHLHSKEESVFTNAIAEAIDTKPSTVSDMLKKLAAKNLVNYEKYKGVTLTPEGQAAALWIIRKHRLWEVFLVEKLHFTWDEVHEVAEQLEHIKSRSLIDKLDQFLGYPKTDPHGDPIPDSNGNFEKKPLFLLKNCRPKEKIIVCVVKDDSKTFLQLLDKMGIRIGSKIEVIEKLDYDGSMEIEIDYYHRKTISQAIAQNILVDYL